MSQKVNGNPNLTFILHIALWCGEEVNYESLLILFSLRQVVNLANTGRKKVIIYTIDLVLIY